MTEVTITYDPEAQAAHISLGPGPHVSEVTEELSDSVLVDYDAAGNVIGIELLGVSEPVLREEAACPPVSSSG